MAKDELGSWMKLSLWVISLVFICGMTYQQFGSFDDRLCTVSEEVKTIREDYHNEREQRLLLQCNVRGVCVQLSFHIVWVRRSSPFVF